MKTIGLIGGMSWESTIPYYRQINEVVKAQLGGLHSAKIILFSVDFAEVEQLQHAGKWHEAGALLAQAAKSLEKAGADFIVICTNTMHKVCDQVMAGVAIPLCHIADATAEQIKRQQIQRIGLLGTGFTMEQDFYKGRLQQQHGIDVLVPNAADRAIVHQIIYDELCLGLIKPQSRCEYRRIMADLAKQGAQGIILGCTEISLLVNQDDATVPLFDTTAIHAQAAAELALRV